MGVNEFLSQLSESERLELINWKFMDNTHIYDFMRDEIYGGSWPELDKGITAAAGIKDPFYIQICYNKDAYGSLDSANSIIFASNSQTGNWYTSMIYNPEDQKWYTGKKGISVANSSWEKIKTLMNDNGWKPVEYIE